MTRRAYWLVVGAYALLALGAAVTLALIAAQARDIDTDNTRLAVAAGIYCEVGLLPDHGETIALERLARLLTPEPVDIDAARHLIHTPSCQRIYDWLKTD